MKDECDFIKELVIVGVVFVFICFGISSFQHDFQLKKAYKLLAEEKAAKIAAMKIATEIINEKNEYIFILQESREQLNIELEDLNGELKQCDSIKKLKRICGNVNNKSLVLALAFTESSLNYKVKHDKDIAQGICGVVPKFHKELLEENNVKLNSLKACEIIYNYYLELNDGNKVAAIKAYKGIESSENMYLVYRVLEIERELK